FCYANHEITLLSQGCCSACRQPCDRRDEALGCETRNKTPCLIRHYVERAVRSGYSGLGNKRRLKRISVVRREKGSTLDRVLQLLAFIAQHDGQYDRQQLASAMGLPELATCKLLTQLNGLGMISENLLRKVVAGPQFQQVA